MLNTFDHVHSAHCESGAFAALLRHGGLKLSEALVFGIGSGLFFLYLPFVKLYDLPLVSFRDMPNAIISRTSRRLGVKLRTVRFRNPDAGMRALDTMLENDRPVGMQTGVFWLPYFPRDLRFQFNGHHVIAFGRDADDYLLSDTVFETTVRCASEDLRRARFAQGPLAPKGLLYYIESMPAHADIEAAVLAGLRSTVSRMTRIPLPLMGVAGIRRLARALGKWGSRLPPQSAKSHLAQVIRMQEEIGTGGGGFRFMFAAFLAEAADVLGKPALREVSGMFSEIGDGWREFAVHGAQLIRRAESGPADFEALVPLLLDIAQREALGYQFIRAALESSRR
jgi:hypothetical protein